MTKVENCLKNMKLHDFAHWNIMNKKQVKDLIPVNTMHRVIKWQLHDRIKEVKGFQKCEQKNVEQEICWVTLDSLLGHLCVTLVSL
jgi:hypothetical protein